MNPLLQKFKIQFDAVAPAQERTALPGGDYTCGVEAARLRKATTGTMYVEVAFTVSQGDYVGRKLNLRIYFTDKTIGEGMPQRDLPKLGLSMESLEALDVNVPVAGQFLVSVQQINEGGRPKSEPWQFVRLGD